MNFSINHIIGMKPFGIPFLSFDTKRNTYINVNLWDNIHVVLKLRLGVNWGQNSLGVQSFASMIADLCQDISRVSGFFI